MSTEAIPTTNSKSYEHDKSQDEKIIKLEAQLKEHGELYRHKAPNQQLTQADMQVSIGSAAAVVGMTTALVAAPTILPSLIVVGAGAVAGRMAGEVIKKFVPSLQPPLDDFADVVINGKPTFASKIANTAEDVSADSAKKDTLMFAPKVVEVASKGKSADTHVHPTLQGASNQRHDASVAISNEQAIE